MEEISILPLEIRVKYCELIRQPTDKRRFVDITHNALGKLCRVYYNFHTNKYEYEPVKK